MALQSRAFCFPLYPVVDGCFSFAPALGADPVNSLCAGSCYLHRVDAGVELTVPVVAQFRMKFRKHKKKPQKPILCGYTYLSYISYHIQFARMHKAKLWQNRSKTVAKTRYMELVPLLNRKCQKSTALSISYCVVYKVQKTSFDKRNRTIAKRVSAADRRNHKNQYCRNGMHA